MILNWEKKLFFDEMEMIVIRIWRCCKGTSENIDMGLDCIGWRNKLRFRLRTSSEAMIPEEKNYSLMK